MAIIKINLIIESILTNDELLNKIKTIGKNSAQRSNLLFDENRYDVTLNGNCFSIKQKPFYETVKRSKMAGTAMAEVRGSIDQYKDKSIIRMRIDFANSLMIANVVIVPLITFFWLINPKFPVFMKILFPFLFYFSSVIYIVSVKKYWMRFFSTNIKTASKKSRILLRNLTALAIFNMVVSIILFVISFSKNLLNEKMLSSRIICVVIGILIVNFLAGFFTFLYSALYLKMNLLDILKNISLKMKMIIVMLFLNGLYHLYNDPRRIALVENVIIRNSQWRSFSSVLLFLSFLFMSILFEYRKIMKAMEDKK